MSSTLARYNLRVMLFSNWWLVVMPLAASQLVVYWSLITQRFSPNLPAITVEMVSPVLAAFLAAHVLAPEYRSGVGALLASKPMHIGKLVALRLAAALGFVWALAGLSLAGFYYGMEPYPVLEPAIACMASTLFMAMFAMTFATVLRHALAGFGVSMLVWALDLPPGWPMNPYLTLRSLSVRLTAEQAVEVQPFTQDWWVSKALLAVLALVLYVVHSRLVFTLGSPMTTRRARRALVWAAGVVVFVIVSGAATKVVYGYMHRGQLPRDDAAWFRKQFGVYGPIPVSALFGPNFSRYLGDVPSSWRMEADEADTYGDTPEHIRDLKTIVEKAPRSIWAPSACVLLARLEGQAQPDAEVEARACRLVTDRYPRSPYAATGLRDAARAYAAEGMMDRGAALYREMLERYPGSRHEREALGALSEFEMSQGNAKGALELANRWVPQAPVEEKFRALRVMADAHLALGDRAAGAQAARQTIEAVDAYHVEMRRPERAGDRRRIRWDAEADIAKRAAEEILAAVP